MLCLIFVSCGSGNKDLIPLYDGETYVYYNNKGEVAVKPEINVRYASAFNEDLAMVGIVTDEGDRYGYLNTKGELVVRPKYIQAIPFSEGLAWVVESNGAPKAINKKGEEVLSLSDVDFVWQFSEGLAGFSKKDSDGRQRYGFIDKSGKIVIEPFYDQVLPFTNGLASVMRDEKFGYINRKGELEIPIQFAFASPFSDKGFAAVATSIDHIGVIDKKGTFIVNPKYEEVIVDGDEFIVKEKNKCGIIDKDGKEIIPMDFKVISKFKGQPFTMASIDGNSYGIIDRKGKFAVNPQFDQGSSFIGELAIVASGGDIGLVDTKGKYIVNPRFKDTNLDFFVDIKYMVQSDFFDMDAVVSTIAGQGKGEEYLGVSAASAYGDVKRIYSDLSSGYSSRYTSYKDIELSGDVYINSVVFTFNGPTSKREYNYYDRKYATIELNPSVKTAEYEISFRNEKARNKTGEIVEIVRREFDNRFSGSNTTVNISKSGSSIKIKINY